MNWIITIITAILLISCTAKAKQRETFQRNTPDQLKTLACDTMNIKYIVNLNSAA